MHQAPQSGFAWIDAATGIERLNCYMVNVLSTWQNMGRSATGKYEVNDGTVRN